MRVLVVEDEPDVSSVFRDYLLELGHEPVLVRTAEAALRILETERPDAILLDIHLPGLSGLDFLQLRPVRDSGLPIVAVSGVVTESQARECLRLGAIDFVGKPVAFERLGDVLASVEPLALQHHLATQGTAAERRNTARVQVTFPVNVAAYDGREWNGWALDLSPNGIRVRSDAPLNRGAAVRLTFTPPDGGVPLSTMSLLVRLSDEGQAFRFVNLTEEQTDRLAGLARRLRGS
jgi:DNA-binding response OmpR family regulator